MCYHAEFGRSALKGVGMNTGEPPKLGALELPLLRWEAWLTQDRRPFPTRYHVKFGSSTTKDARIYRIEPQMDGHQATAKTASCCVVKTINIT